MFVRPFKKFRPLHSTLADKKFFNGANFWQCHKKGLMKNGGKYELRKQPAQIKLDYENVWNKMGHF